MRQSYRDAGVMERRGSVQMKAQSLPAAACPLRNSGDGGAK